MGYKTDAAAGIAGGWLAVIIIGVLALVAGGIFWGIQVATSNAKGAGDTIIKNNSVENRTEAQKRFEIKYAAVKAYKEKVSLYKTNLAANPTDKTAQQTLLGVQSACVSSVNDYNAEARKVLSMDWKAADLPDSLTTTGCE